MTIRENHGSDVQWNRFKNESFKDLLAPAIDHKNKTYYLTSKRSGLKWFAGDGVENAYEQRSKLKFARAKSAGSVKALSTYYAQSMLPYESRFLRNRVPPGGGPLMRTSWSGRYMEWLWSTGRRLLFNWAGRRESPGVLGTSRSGQMQTFWNLSEKIFVLERSSGGAG